MTDREKCGMDANNEEDCKNKIKILGEQGGNIMTCCNFILPFEVSGTTTC